MLASLGPAGLKTVDTLIMAGIAATRAEASGGPWTASARGQRTSGPVN